jgi:serine/threonine protein kinase
MIVAPAATARAARYRAPERRSGHHGDERSDVYSLGVIVRDLLGGGANAGSFQPVLNRMLAEDPTQRYPNAAAALQALEGLA